MRRGVKRKAQLLLGAASCILSLIFLTTLRVLLVDIDVSSTLGQQQRRHGSLQSLRNHHGAIQQSLKDFSQQQHDNDGDKKDKFVRYSQRYQSNHQDKLQETQKLLNDKRKKLKEELHDLLQDSASHSKSMREAWHSFQDMKNDNQDILQAEHGMRRGYRPSIKHGRRYPRILYFLHIHKSAGSTVCRQAYLNRISANYNQNCNVQADQHCCGNNDTLQAQRDFAKQTQYDLVAAEQEMYDSMDPDSYDYIVSLRNSRRRYYSHWNHLVTVAKKNRQHELELLQRHEQHAYPLAETAVEWVQQTIQGRGSDGNQHLQAALEDPIHWNYTIRDYSGTVYPVGNFTKWYYGQPDNYNVRMICGVRCTHIAKYRLSRELFRYALQRLTDFAHVIFVEDMEASFAAFARHYGWQYNVAAAHHGQRLNATDLTSALQQQHSDWDPYMSVLDDALYEFAQRKYLGATKEDLKALMKKGVEFANQALVDEYFEKGPGRDCPNECCGVCSKW
jgi:hypothetical protein